MQPIFSPSRLFGVGFVLLLAVNVFVLLGVSANRSEKPETLIELTERELSLPYKWNDENSGLALKLDWRIISDNKNDTYRFYGHWGVPIWFNARKLIELGFTIDETTCSYKYSNREKEPLPKNAFIVFEYDGKAYQEALRGAEEYLNKTAAELKAHTTDKDTQDRFEEARRRLERERVTESRLFAIDAGLDPGTLREQYSNRSKFIIMPGVVELTCRSYNKKREVAGRISDIRVDKINVPLKHRKLFDAIVAQDKFGNRKQQGPRYKVEVAYGSRFEPWIRAVKEIGVSRP
ncbi:MAG: DUF4824 family protein [Deltaproteobacteria bacterium]|nr:DUF4824 family protein [Deltaproteobacteria bacterium]